MKHFLDIKDCSRSELMALLTLAQELKKERRLGEFRQCMNHKHVALIFEKPSNRTRVSFEVGIRELGGNSLVLKREDVGLGDREPIKDMARVLDRFVDAVMVRTFDHDILLQLARYSAVPIINGLTDHSHPCQALADFMTILDHFGSFDGQRICYLGDLNNVCRSLVEMAGILGIEIIVSGPKTADSLDTTINYVEDPEKAIQKATVVCTDTWVSMGEEETGKNVNVFEPYQVNAQLMALADPTAIFLHCLPAHRGEEVTDEVIESNASKVFDEAENRLHVQKAVLCTLFGI